MGRYIVYATHQVAKRGELPDIRYTYVADSSHIGFHYDFTSLIDNAYVFDESELNYAYFLKSACGMQIKNINRWGD